MKPAVWVRQCEPRVNPRVIRSMSDGISIKFMIATWLSLCLIGGGTLSPAKMELLTWLYCVSKLIC